MKEEGEDGSPKRSTPIKVDNPNQFAPQGSDPREFKQKQKQVIVLFCSVHFGWIVPEVRVMDWEVKSVCFHLADWLFVDI